MRARFAPVRFALAMLLPALFIPAARAQDPVIPIFQDMREQLPKPVLSGVQRLRFLTTTDFAPFNFLDGDGRLSGFHVDLARAICAELGLIDRCQIQALPWSELDGTLEAGEADAIIAGIAISTETRASYSFSRPYLQFPARFVMPKATAVPEPVYDRLKGKRVGVVGGSAHEQMLRAYFPQVEAVVFDTADAMLEALSGRKVDAAFGDGMRLSFWLGSPEGAAGCCRFAGGPYLAPEFLGRGLAIAAPRNDTTLVPAFNYALQRISGDGTLADLYLRYFPVSFF